jgi:hypothetical protein
LVSFPFYELLQEKDIKSAQMEVKEVRDKGKTGGGGTAVYVTALLGFVTGQLHMGLLFQRPSLLVIIIRTDFPLSAVLKKCSFSLYERLKLTSKSPLFKNIYIII